VPHVTQQRGAQSGHTRTAGPG